MRETMGGYTPEHERKENRYSMDRVTIEPIADSNLSVALRELDWPLELNGKGISESETGEMTLRYPPGDVLLSYVTTIHELGHLRQHELNPTRLKDLKNQTHDNLLAEESDAWERGWRRFAEANPERLNEFEQLVRNSGNTKLKDLGSFAQLYKYIRDNALQLVQMEKVLFENEDKRRGFELLAKDIEKTGWGNFLIELKDLRIGQTVESEQIKQDIRNVIEKVIEE
ncbi:MAG: hypothetical protein V1738_02700 [Patescibacteria group bacterium]